MGVIVSVSVTELPAVTLNEEAAGRNGHRWEYLAHREDKGGRDSLTRPSRQLHGLREACIQSVVSNAGCCGDAVRRRRSEIDH
jgi:hypothetical protein